MKNIFIAGLIALFTTTLKAQTVTMDMESGDRNIDAANCWSFPGTSYTRRIQTSEVISGFWTGKTGQLSSLTNTNGVWSPWMDMASGNITFKHKLFGGFTGTSKQVEVVLQKYSDSTETTIYTFNYNSGNANTVQDASVAVSVSGIYRVKFLFSGSGGSSRGLIDVISIPGTIVGDPSNGCAPQTSNDADNDGIADGDDDYPNDQYRAFNNYLVSSTYGTLLYEDLWPSRGDYDFNDVVVDYRVNTISNASNEVVEMEIKVVARAAGASYKDAFAIELRNIAPDKILSITGGNLPGTLFTRAANGTESGQTYANIPIFDDVFKVLVYQGGNGGINTNPNVPKADYDTITVLVKFKDGTTTAPGGVTNISAITFANFNPYIVINQERNREVHLIDKAPTDKANTSLFGTQEDRSNPGQGKYYRTANNLPWALAISQSIPYPTEKTDFSLAFSKFIQWAESNGASFSDWYIDNSGYRNTSNIYNK
jgi:LruC domain-containing protein